MTQLIALAIGILTGIIVCSLTDKNRSFKTFMISFILIFLVNFFTYESHQLLYVDEKLNIHKLVQFIGECAGIGFVTGMIGYFIGNSMYKVEKFNELPIKKDEEIKQNDI